jgi:hypothetical protein
VDLSGVWPFVWASWELLSSKGWRRWAGMIQRHCKTRCRLWCHPHVHNMAQTHCFLWPCILPLLWSF